MKLPNKTCIAMAIVFMFLIGVVPTASAHVPVPLENHGTPTLHTVYGSTNATPTADTYVDSTDPGYKGGATLPYMRIYYDSTIGDSYALLMRWNLTTAGVPVNSTIDGAWLHIHNESLFNRGGVEDWREYSQIDWSEGAMDYNHYLSYLVAYPPPTIGVMHSETAGSGYHNRWNNITATTMIASGSHKVYLYAFASDAGHSGLQYYDSKEGTAGVRPGLQVNWHYDWYTYNATGTQKYLGWLGESGIMTVIALLGLVLIIGTPVFYYKFRGQGDWPKAVMGLIGMEVLGWGLFYAAVVVFA